MPACAAPYLDAADLVTPGPDDGGALHDFCWANAEPPSPLADIWQPLPHDGANRPSLAIRLQ
jgi:hypothetical protein